MEKINLFTVLKKYIQLINGNKNKLFSLTVEEQKEILNKFPEPKDDIERSYFQYLCQMEYNGKIKVFLLNFSSIFMIGFYLIYLSIFRNIVKTENDEAVFFVNELPKNILPSSLKEKYFSIKYSNYGNKYHINFKDIKFIYNIFKRYPLSWFFIFKIIYKISIYSSEINNNNNNNISAVITYAEFSYTSSILTKYCEMYKVKHINIMHGEKLFFIRDSFFRFHEFYIWNNYYEKLFKELKAFPDQFIVEVPPSLKIEENYKIDQKIDYTYYLGAENKEELLVVYKYLKKLKNQGYIVSLRPHPRYSNISIIKSIFKNVIVEDPKLIEIEKSIMRTKNAISLYSSVLNQAYYNNINIIIDDLTNIKKYKALKSLKYIMLEKDHTLLSEIS